MTKNFYISSFDQEKIFTQQLSNDKKIKHYFFLCHGIGGESTALLPLCQQILDTIPNSCCVVWDFRGHGRSSSDFPKTNFIEETNAKDLEQVINFFKAKNYYLLGHSFGAVTICQSLTESSTQNAKRIFLISAPLKKAGLNLGRMYWYLRLQRLKAKPKQPRSTSDFLSFQKTTDFSPFRILSDIQAIGFWTWVYLYLSISGWNNQQFSYLNQQKIVIFYGCYDRILPKLLMENDIKSLPKAHKHCLMANHHQAIFTHKTEIAQIIKASI